MIWKLLTFCVPMLNIISRPSLSIWRVYITSLLIPGPFMFLSATMKKMCLANQADAIIVECSLCDIHVWCAQIFCKFTHVVLLSDWSWSVVPDGEESTDSGNWAESCYGQSQEQPTCCEFDAIRMVQVVWWPLPLHHNIIIYLRACGWVHCVTDK